MVIINPDSVVKRGKGNQGEVGVQIYLLVTVVVVTGLNLIVPFFTSVVSAQNMQPDL